MIELACGHQIPGVQQHYMQRLAILQYTALVRRSKLLQLFLNPGTDPNAVSYYRETSCYLTLSKSLQGSKYTENSKNGHLKVEVSLEYINPEYNANEIYPGITRQRIAAIGKLPNHPKAVINMQESKGAPALHRSHIIFRKLIKRGSLFPLRTRNNIC